MRFDWWFPHYVSHVSLSDLSILGFNLLVTFKVILFRLLLPSICATCSGKWHHWQQPSLPHWFLLLICVTFFFFFEGLLFLCLLHSVLVSPRALSLLPLLIFIPSASPLITFTTQVSIALHYKLQIQLSFHWLLSLMLLRQFLLFMFKCYHSSYLALFSLHPPGSIVKILGIIFAPLSHLSHSLCSARHQILRELLFHHPSLLLFLPPKPLPQISPWVCQLEYSWLPLLCPSFSLMIVIISLFAKHLLGFQDLDARSTLWKFFFYLFSIKLYTPFWVSTILCFSGHLQLYCTYISFCIRL